MSEFEILIRITRRLLSVVVISVVLLIACGLFLMSAALGWFPFLTNETGTLVMNKPKAVPEIVAHPKTVAEGQEESLVTYGKNLIAHTALYLGPKGKVSPTTNGMNCQNCHLSGGMNPYAPNFILVNSSYPKFRHRSGTVEGIEKRINDCLERSLNGEGIDASSREMNAMVAYIKWVGEAVTDAVKVIADKRMALPFLDRPASPQYGKTLFEKHCTSCHGRQGEGVKKADGEWLYPPLWGPNSYNTGAGLFRLSSFARFIRNNMPFGVTPQNPLLTDEEAWDIAAYVNTMPRPQGRFPHDWPDISKKPVDHPFGPYADGLSEERHKYGPFGPLIIQVQN